MRSLLLSHPSTPLSLSFFSSLSSPSSLSSSACTPASRRARLDPTPLHHSASPTPVSFYLDHRRCPSLVVLSVSSLSHSLRPSSTLSLSLRLSLPCSRPHIPSPPTDRLGNPLSLHRRFIPRFSLAFNPQRPTSAHRGVAWYTMRYDLPALFPLSFSRPRPFSEPSRTAPRSPASLFLPRLQCIPASPEKRESLLWRDQYDRTAHASVSLYLNPSPPLALRRVSLAVPLVPSSSHLIHQPRRLALHLGSLRLRRSRDPRPPT